MAVTEYSLQFALRHSYSPDAEITIPIVLSSDRSNRVSFEAKLDTGSTYCIFENMYAAWLNFDLVSGRPARIATATGAF